VKTGVIRTVLAIAALLGVWEGACRALNIDVATLPAPSDAWRALVHAHAVLLPALRATTVEAVVGLLAALLVGGLLGVLIAIARPIRAGLEPVVVVSQTIPVIALGPLLVTWLGFGLGPKVIIVALIAVFPVIAAVSIGVRQADASVDELLRGAGAGRLRRMRLVELPAAVPAIVSGARVSALLVVPGAVTAEWVGSTNGLGQLLLIYDRDGRTTLTFSCVLLLAALGLVLWAIVSLVDTWLTRRGLLAER
jgi:ABC-type nitrate/sulfonate/bicarbonate transport system permease component